MLRSAAVALCLSGCAGGGGGGGAPSAPVVQPAASMPPVTATPVAGADTFRTTEYNRMGALDAIHAADAYALGYTGAGVTIGIIDFNFELIDLIVFIHHSLGERWTPLDQRSCGISDCGFGPVADQEQLFLQASQLLFVLLARVFPFLHRGMTVPSTRSQNCNNLVKFLGAG